MYTYIFINNFLNSLSAWWLLIHSIKIVHWKKTQIDYQMIHLRNRTLNISNHFHFTYEFGMLPWSKWRATVWKMSEVYQLITYWRNWETKWLISLYIAKFNILIILKFLVAGQLPTWPNYVIYRGTLFAIFNFDLFLKLYINCLITMINLKSLSQVHI